MSKYIVLILFLVISIINLVVIFKQESYDINLKYLGEKYKDSKRVCYYFDRFIYLRINCKDYDYVKETMMSED